MPHTLTMPQSPGQTVSNSASSVDKSHHVFFFYRRKWQVGLTRGIQGAVMLGAGAFLLSQIPSTPRLVVQMLLLGTGLVAAGGCILWNAATDLLGYFRIDAEGLHLRSGYRIRSVPWSSITAWDVNQGSTSNLNRSVNVVVTSPHKPLFIDGEYLRPTDLLEINGAMLRLAPQKNC